VFDFSLLSCFLCFLRGVSLWFSLPGDASHKQASPFTMHKAAGSRTQPIRHLLTTERCLTPDMGYRPFALSLMFYPVHLTAEYKLLVFKGSMRDPVVVIYVLHKHDAYLTAYKEKQCRFMRLTLQQWIYTSRPMRYKNSNGRVRYLGERFSGHKRS
jgi:hypothetical protein